MRYARGHDERLTSSRSWLVSQVSTVKSRIVPRYDLRTAVLVLILATSVFEAATLRGLYADGADFLAQILATKNFYFLNASRRFTEILTQLPVVLAIKAGLSKLSLLIFIHSVALVMLPIIFWILSLWRLYEDDLFWPMFVLFCIIHFNLAFFAIGEYNVAYSLVALSLAILAARAQISDFWAVVVLFAAICLITSYEALVFLGPLLAVLACHRLVNKQPLLTGLVKSTLVLCLVCYLSATIIAASSISHPRDPAVFADAVDMRYNARNSLLLLSLSFALSWGLQCLSESTSVKRLATVIAISTLLALGWPELWSAPGMQYSSRVIGGIIILLFGAIVLLERPINNYLHLDLKRAASANVYYSLSFFVILLASDVTRSVQFMDYLDNFKIEVRSHAGLIPLEATNLSSHRDDVFGWEWTHPSLSILLRDDARQAVILNSGDELSGPKGSIPDLSSYYPHKSMPAP